LHLGNERRKKAGRIQDDCDVIWETVMNIPRSRAEAKGTPFEEHWDTPSNWPDDVHKITNDLFDRMGIRPADSTLFWDGRPLVTKGSVNLEGWSLVLAGIATAATVTAALWPVIVHFGWI
jgi:hypothetical protein